MADACPNCGVWLGNEPLPNDSAWERLQAEVERLRAAGDALAKWLWRGGGDLADMIAAVAAWEEARRG